ncbi:biotin synthase [Boothiomyces macroporosus]|uniref:biotin synthase n=1 Tax=Boothiomyces macroporosus TaxID=261099 RepID=A0AAD5Y5R3_9FUNG|nr:biotin synthase [Boothiomyces macroporosus]
MKRFGTLASALSSKDLIKHALSVQKPRNNWTFEEIEAIYNSPLMELSHQAAIQHRRFHDPSVIQQCTLYNIKSGGCTEDCSYCAQSSKYKTGLKPTKLAQVPDVVEAARIAKQNGSTRFCMGAAWRDMKGRKTNLKQIKEMVNEIRSMDMEVCVTLGMLSKEQIEELKESGLTAYNHNIDTSPEHYPSIITTRSFSERLDTIANVQSSGVKVCTGGILGLGETPRDHVSFLKTLSNLNEHPESLPINTLVPIKGTPLGEQKPLPFSNLLRTIATARIIMPKSIIRLAAGRTELSEEKQILCFNAGANAIFTGEKMLTTDAVGWDVDAEMFKTWGLRQMKSFEKVELKQEEIAEQTLSL